QVGVFIRLCGAKIVALIGGKRARHGRVGFEAGHGQQAALNQLVESRLTREMQGIDVHEWAAFAGAAGLVMLPGVAFVRGGRLTAWRQQLTGAEQGKAGENKQFREAWHGLSGLLKGVGMLRHWSAELPTNGV